MNDFIKAVESIENENPGLSMLEVVKGIRKTAGFQTNLIKNYLGDVSDAHNLAMNPSVAAYVTKVVHHKVSKLGEEEGVVLTLDGSNVALAPMLLGLDAGLQSTPKNLIPGLYPLTLTENLVASFVHHAHNKQASVPLGTKGFWDSIKSPKVYTLSGLPSLATDALLTGGIDGIVLGSDVAKSNHPETSLSHLLKSYYSHELDNAPRLISQKRRMNFRKLVHLSSLKNQVVDALRNRLGFHKDLERKTLDAIMHEGFEEFVHVYAGNHFRFTNNHLKSVSRRVLVYSLLLPTSLSQHHYEVSVGCCSVHRIPYLPVSPRALPVHPPHV